MLKLGLYQYKCKQCGKKFEGRKEYGWRVPEGRSNAIFHYFCSYGCMRQYEKRDKKVPSKREKQYLDLLNSGMNAEQVARELGVSSSRVRYVRIKWRENAENYH